jgi:hypothetical protein
MCYEYVAIKRMPKQLALPFRKRRRPRTSRSGVPEAKVDELLRKVFKARENPRPNGPRGSKIGPKPDGRRAVLFMF